MPLRPPGEVPDFRRLKQANLRRSRVAVGVLWSLLGLIGAGVGVAIVAVEAVRPLWHGAVLGGAIGGLLALLATVVAFVRGEQTTLAMLRASDPPDEVARRIHNILDELVIAAGVRRPTLHYIDDPFPNACAIGLHNHPGHICVTRGLVELLERDELAGVVAHELAHLRNEDATFSTVTATLYGSIWFLREFFADLMENAIYRRIHSHIPRTRWGRSSKHLGGAFFIGLVGWVVLAVISLVAWFVVLLASRSREWMADMAAVEITRDPGALADALQKIADSGRRPTLASRGVQHLYFVNPFPAGEAASALFSTHPPITERISLLRRMAGGPRAARP